MVDYSHVTSCDRCGKTYSVLRSARHKTKRCGLNRVKKMMKNVKVHNNEQGETEG